MAWVKLDDRFSGNPKVRQAWRQNRASIGLYAMALTYAAQHETDGVIGGWWVDEMLPGKDGQRAAKALTDSGLWTWDEAGDSYAIHDYLQHNESRADAQARRERDRERKARGGKRGGIVDSDHGPDDFHAESAGNPPGVRADSGSTRARVPSRPVPSTPTTPPSPPRGERPGDALNLGDTPPPPVPSSGRKRDQDDYEQTLAAWSGLAVPEATEHYRLAGARHALSVIEGQRKQPTLRGVRWLAGHGQVNAFGLDDEQRAAIRREFITAHDANEAA